MGLCSVCALCALGAMPSVMSRVSCLVSAVDERNRRRPHPPLFVLCGVRAHVDVSHGLAHIGRQINWSLLIKIWMAKFMCAHGGRFIVVFRLNVNFICWNISFTNLSHTMRLCASKMSPMRASIAFD